MIRAPKAYTNLEFLKSREARPLRILAEYLEPEKKFHEENITHTIVFFGSSRIREGNEDTSKTAKYYRIAEEFAFQLASWSKELKDPNQKGESFTICSGGGPGIMEAANRGARRANAATIGLNISIPFEQLPNDYISPHLNFEFHYFFMRKLWFLYHAKALVVFPGGFGTLDEFFETLTLVQTQKLAKQDLIILLYDQKFWKSLLNFELLIDYGLISPGDTNLFNFFDTVDEGLGIIKPRLEKVIKGFKK